MNLQTIKENQNLLIGIGVGAVALIILIFLVITGRVSFGGKANILSALPVVTIGGTTINVHTAKTKDEHFKGLTSTSSLAQNEGMLYIYDTPSKPFFSMKDMSYPLDIIWIDKDMKVTRVMSDLAFIHNPAIYTTSVPISYVLEVNAGFAKAHDIQAGDVLTIHTQ